jgi:hypothetical protein
MLAGIAMAASAHAQTLPPRDAQGDTSVVAQISTTPSSPSANPSANPFAPSATPNAFTPPSDSDTSRLPTFKRGSTTAKVRPPVAFTPPPSGASRTGFDSTNSRKKAAAKPSPLKPDTSIPAAPKSTAATDEQRAVTFSSSSPPAPPPPSPYQKPLPTAAANSFAARIPVVPVGVSPAASIIRRKKLVAEGDPYEPLGVRAGSFDLYPAVELYTGYDTNPGALTVAKGSMLYTVAPEFRAQSNWSRHELKADLRGSYSYYQNDQTPSVSRPKAEGKIDGRIDVTRDDRIDLGARLFVGTDYPNSPNLQAGLDRLPIFTTVGGIAGYTHRFNRLELGVKGTADRTVWQSSALVDGSSSSNDDRNYNQYGGTLRAGYELTPGLIPYVEGGGDTRVHDLNTDYFGYQRDSTGWTGRVGSTFELSRLLVGDLSVGYTMREYQDARLDSLKGLLFDGALTWSATPLTNVKLTGKTTVGESNVPGVSGIFYRNAGLQVDHDLRRWLVATVKFGFGLDTYQGGFALSDGSTGDREDQRYSVGLGLTYKVTRELWLKGEVRREWLHSNVAGYDYNANVFLVGLRLQR